MVSKALVVGVYQHKLAELARFPDVELTAIVPPRWRDQRGDVAFQRGHAAGYDLIVAPLLCNGSYHLHFYPTLGRLLHRLRPDILHMDEEPYNLATWHALRLARQVGARSLFFTWQNLHRRYPWPFRAFEQANYRRAAYAIVGNRDAAAVLRAKGYAGPVSVIPQFGVDPDLFRPQSAVGNRQSAVGSPQPILCPLLPASCSPFIIGYAGGLVPEKGVDLLLRACAGGSEDWSLLIQGDGPERSRLAALATDLGVAARVHFLGRRPSTEMPAFYQALDVLVLPSVSRPNWIEQFGRVLVEAMACGVPVIGSTCGEIPHVIGDAGLVFFEGDVAALREALVALAADPPRRAGLAAAGRARVLAQFTQAQVAAATYRVYTAVANC
jgi:glycosyltransferase involved in cell wall biosynthesis